MAVSVEILKGFGILRELPEAALAQLASQSVLKRYARREIVIDPGEQEASLCFLFEGSLQGVDFTLDGREVGLYFVRPGDFCGEVGLFGEQTNPEFVVALAKSQVVLMPYAAVSQIMYETRPLIAGLSGRLAKRVSEHTRQRAILSLNSIPHRIYRQLVQLAGLDTLHGDDAGSIPVDEAGDESCIDIAYPPTHQEMAIMLNTSRETVTRVFQALQADGLVQRNGTSSLLIKKPEALYQLAYGDN
ncbi:Crp/Fnr family transcriptional regulator [Oceanospirillum linum]|uniref:Crp/Fnr family transcriptional regulator n=1 Tax=Oceanospirillum linum TaxID=966 RepID=A0A1T1HAS3_OCELI|nr:Crp/Fnr family transcriptional regulator [Oceanospirillum linum]OOV86968.1 hypothetical protein BTA35_0208060 [Oceanospirillum linum]SEF69964.1 cAMP-binding domain of CRP or a regulatory subunit of cAMP-dependent protein kinases [Oleiphilus messinensis]SMP15170.1 cAMP-binding domain of CRP or a regulatory subunit of cAMP-dependent protein kinases [Oceanospirillum linum]